MRYVTSMSRRREGVALQPHPQPGELDPPRNGGAGPARRINFYDPPFPSQGWQVAEGTKKYLIASEINCLLQHCGCVGSNAHCRTEIGNCC